MAESRLCNQQNNANNKSLSSLECVMCIGYMAMTVISTVTWHFNSTMLKQNDAEVVV